jgi:5-oxopent-3-ene-1,2,5-tricarboxylate decarboxylase/2-hydroxyhepta-2,4-diene-1,7-dioate isomerase
MPLHTVPFDEVPHRWSGNVFGVLMNHRDALDALGTAVREAPYKAPPNGVVLYIKPRNTLAGPGDDIVVPVDAPELEIGASLGLVIGRTACRLTESEALEHLAGYVIVNDVSVPHASFYRPQVRFKARDGFCPIGPRLVARSQVADPAALGVRVFVDGRLVHSAGTGGTIRSIPRLLADVTDFMTLQPGDVLMTGVAAGAPRVRAGQGVAIEIDGLGRLENRFVVEGAVDASVGRGFGEAAR